ncbi:MAG: hypothetical protein QJR14_10955 [Bacillota bacterium]|nr:hypothetical protein [Bacillota bacterium]
MESVATAEGGVAKGRRPGRGFASSRLACAGLALLLSGVVALAGCTAPGAGQAGRGAGSAPAVAPGEATATRTAGGAGGSGDSGGPQAPAARSFAGAEALRAAWNGALDPFEADAAVGPFETDSNGQFIAFAGVHRLLAGQIQGSGYALDVLLDHPEQNGAAARQAILPLARILMRTVQPGLSAAQQARVLAGLGLTGDAPAIPDRFEYGARTFRSGDVTYVLSFDAGLIFSAEHGSTSPGRDSRLEIEVKRGQALSATEPVVGLTAAQVEAALAPARALPPLNAGLLADPTRLFDWLEQVARLTGQLLPAPLAEAAPPAGVAVLVPEKGMEAIRTLLGQFYTGDFTGHLVGDEAWANMASGVVKGGSLQLQRPIYYGEGRLFVLPEPPFAEGETYWVQVPLWADGTMYELGFLRQLGGGQGQVALKGLDVKRAGDGSATVTVDVLLPAPPGAADAAARAARFVFQLVPAGRETFRIGGIQTPPCACE